MRQLPQPVFTIDPDDPKGRLYVLLENFELTISAALDWHVVIPAGFKTDFASLPPLARFVVWLMGLQHIVTIAAIVHDYFYATHAVARAVADGIFRQMLGEFGAPRWFAKAVEIAVRVFGWYAYRTGPERLAKNCPGLIVANGIAPGYEGIDLI